MNNIKIDLSGDTILLAGAMDFDTVPAFWQQCQQVFANRHVAIQFDLQGVSRCDSAGLALLIALTRLGKTQGKKLSFLNLPHQMLAVAKVSGVDKILPIL